MTGKKALRVSDYVEHILQAIDRIESYVAGVPQSTFTESSLLQDAVIRNFEIIGEAANKIQGVDPGFARQHRGLKLEQAYRMRNALAHSYDSVKLLTLWNTIANDLPSLNQQAADILKAMNHDK